MEVTLQKENEDGSAEFDLSLSPLEVQALVNLGLIEVLKKAIEEGKQYEPTSEAVSGESSVGNAGGREASCKDGTGEQSCESGQCRFCTKAP